MSIKELPAEVVVVILAVSGGLARYLSDFLRGEKFKMSMLVANLFLSGFSGLMFSLFGRTLGMSSEWLYILSGIGGFMSTEALKFLAQKIRKTI